MCIAAITRYVCSYVFLADDYDWCIVPDSGYDIIVFAGVAVVVSCLFRGKFSNLMILIAGMLLLELLCWRIHGSN